MSCSSQHRKIASNLLLSGGKLLPNRVVEVDCEGRIVAIEEVDSKSIDGREGVEFYSGIMVAGFVNAHCHLELSYLRGAIEQGGGFAAFASKIGRVRGLFSDEERQRAIRQADAEMYRGGVAAVGDILNGDSSYVVKSESDIEYRSFAEVFGLKTSDLSCVEPLLEMPMTSITPHSTYSLQDGVFRSIVERAMGQATGQAAEQVAERTVESKTPLSIHFMESPVERELFEGRGYLHDWYLSVGYDFDFQHYGSPAERLVKSIPSEQSLLLVHNCCITQRDIDIVMGHFTAPIYWVVCPRSNSYIEGLRPPLELLRRNGLNICVGTDSLASNWSLSILEELRMMEDAPLVERLDWATRVGARALAMPHLGDIEVGKRPSINILSGVDYQAMELTEKSRVRRII